MKQWTTHLLITASLALLPGTVLAKPKKATATQAVMDINSLMVEQQQWAGLSTKTIMVGDINWTYSEGGNPSKPTIMLVHGFSGDRNHWNMLAAKLTKNYHVIIPDLPAHGATEVPESYDYQVAELTTSLRRFAEAMNITHNLHVVGHSLGGAVSLLYASMYFMDIQSLTLISTAGLYKTTKSPYSKDPSLAIQQLQVQQKGDLKRVFNMVMTSPPFVPSAILDLEEQRMIDALPKLSKMTQRLLETAKLYSSDEFYLGLRAIEAPTLIVWGDSDPLFDLPAVAELQQELKNEQPPVILRNVGHLPMFEADQKVADALLGFLQGAGGKPNPFAK